MSFPLSYFKSLRLINVNLLINSPIQKSCIQIHLMDVPSHSRNQKNKWSYCCIPSCGSKGFLIIISFLLWEDSYYKPCFALVYAPICNVTYLVYPVWSDYRFFTWPWDNLLDIILHYGSILFLHNITPLLMFSCIFIGGGFCFNKICHICNISWILFRSFTFPRGAWCCMSFCFLKSIFQPNMPLLIFWNNHLLYMITMTFNIFLSRCLLLTIIVPRDILKYRYLFFIRVNLNIPWFLISYSLIKDDIPTYFNLMMLLNIDSIWFLWSTISHKYVL